MAGKPIADGKISDPDIHEVAQRVYFQPTARNSTGHGNHRHMVDEVLTCEELLRAAARSGIDLCVLVSLQGGTSDHSEDISLEYSSYDTYAGTGHVMRSQVS